MTQYYHVIRSSKINLDALDAYLNYHNKGSLIRPRLNMLRVSRKTRRLSPYKIFMYPGYAFTTPEATPDLTRLKDRWTHHFVRSPQTNEPCRVPLNQVEFAIRMEQKSIVFATSITKGTRVKFTDPLLKGLRGTIQGVQNHYIIVWPDKHTFPITCNLNDIDFLPR